MASAIRLANGLQVILQENHAAPITSTWIWYRVGSRHEVEGYTGLAHWVEHMTFKGSAQYPKGTMMRAIDRHGGYINAMTSYDFTAYYATLPSDHAELALGIEADRMATAHFDPEEVEAERTVVIAERQGSENDPAYALAEEMSAAAFRVHPYHHQTIGWQADIENITRDQLYAHYQRYYQPNNAVLVIVGDFDSPATIDLVERYFAAIPPAASPPVPSRAEPPQRGERRITLRMPGSAPLVRVAYHTPQAAHPDFLPMVVLDSLLSGGKAIFASGGSSARSTRLYRALVETQLAVSTGSHYHPSYDPFLLALGATVRDEHKPEEVEQALLAEIAKLQQDLVAPGELETAIRQTRAQFIYASESVSDQALTLGFLEIVDSHKRLGNLLGELSRVTAEDVQRVARAYLAAENRTVGWFMPTGQGDGGHTAGAYAQQWSRSGPDFCAYARGGKSAISAETVLRKTLSNGMIVLIQPQPASPSVTIEGEILAGSVFDTDATAGLANLTASMLRRGTAAHTFQELNSALDATGTSLGYSAGPEDVMFGGHALIEDLDLLVGTIAETLLAPVFPQAELEKLRGQLLTHLGILHNDTGYRADRAFVGALYPAGHAYARATTGSRDSLRSLDVRDLARFHSTYYQPTTLVLSIVGAVEAQRVLDKIESAFGHWHAAQPAPPRVIPPAATPNEIIVRRELLPGKSQADLIWGVVGMPRTSPDYYPAMMANIVLGRLGLMGRLGESVREKQGLAYYVSSTLQASAGPSPWAIVAGVQPQHIQSALDSILREVQRLGSEPMTDEELQDCRSFLTGALPLHLETNEDIASFLLDIEGYGLGLDHLERYPHILAAINQEDIQRVVQQYLTLDHYVLAMAGPLADPI
jgi:zinc protease